MVSLAGKTLSANVRGLTDTPEAPNRRLRAYTSPNLCAQNIVEMIHFGVFDRFPQMKFYWGETQADWLPHWIESGGYGWYTRFLYEVNWKRTLGEYVKDHCIFNFTGTPQIGGWEDVHYLHRWGGENNLTWGSDVPHQVTTYPFSRLFIERAFDGESESLKRKVLVQTVCDFFGLDTEKALTPTPPGGPYLHPNLTNDPGFYKDDKGRWFNKAATMLPQSLG